MAAPAEVTMDDLTGKFVMNHKLSDPIDSLLALQGLSWFLRKAIGLATVTLTVRQYKTATDTEAFLSQSKSSSDEKSAEETTHVDITQVASGGISTTQENRTLDWREREHSDRIFGNCMGRTRFYDSSFSAAPSSTTTPDPSAQPESTSTATTKPTDPAAVKGDVISHGFEMVGSGKPQIDQDPLDEKFLQAKVLSDGVTESSWCEDTSPDGSGKKNTKHVQSWVINVDAGSSGGWTAEQTWGFERLPSAGGKRYYTRRVVVRRDHADDPTLKRAKVERARLVYDYLGGVGDADGKDGESDKARWEKSGKDPAGEELDVEY